jgi:signal transduction histidine kinase
MNRYNEAMTQRPLPKRILLVNRDFQLRYAGAGLMAGLASTLITAVLIIYPLFAFKIVTISFFLPWPILMAITAAILLNSIIQVMFGILLTHRIAGPIFNLVRQLRMIAHGRWNIKMRQRNLDELGIVVRHLNEMSEELTKAVWQDIGSVEKIQSLLAGLEANPNQLVLANQYLDEMNNRFKMRIQDRGGRA